MDLELPPGVLNHVSQVSQVVIIALSMWFRVFSKKPLLSQGLLGYSLITSCLAYISSIFWNPPIGSDKCCIFFSDLFLLMVGTLVHASSEVI